jgi:hypothetical protein
MTSRRHSANPLRSLLLFVLIRLLSERNKEISIPELSEKALIAPTEPAFCGGQFPFFQKQYPKTGRKTVTALCNFPHFDFSQPRTFCRRPPHCCAEHRI